MSRNSSNKFIKCIGGMDRSRLVETGKMNTGCALRVLLGGYIETGTGCET